MARDEFDLIGHFFRRDTTAAPWLQLGIGDDAALLQLPPGESLAVTTDTLVAGRHFPHHAEAGDIGWKALAVNLSDLAAMGARPLGVTLALTLPVADEAWLTGFSAGFFALAQQTGVPLIGGDTTRGPLSITVTALGAVPVSDALRRAGARAGDRLYISGHPGDAGLGLALSMATLPLPVAASLCAETHARALARLARPSPRLALGLALRGLASAALDVSDGLLQDLGHLLTASGVGAELRVDALPLSAALQDCARHDPLQVRRWALSAGDDYELLFTVPAHRHDEVMALSAALSLPLTWIGDILSSAGLRLTAAGRPWEHELPTGYLHFSGTSDDQAPTDSPPASRP